MDKKKRILLFWGYQRKAWVAPFEKLKDQFNFTFLYYIRSSDETEVHTDLPKIYWSDYSSAQEILDEQKPDKLILMDISGAHTIALNYVARKRGVFTAVVQHGLFHSFDKYLKLQEVQAQRRAEENANSSAPRSSERSFLIKFYLRSVGYGNLPMAKLLFDLQRKKRKMNDYLAFSELHSESRRAQEYWVFTRTNAELYKKRDGIAESRMKEYGNPEMDAFCERSNDFEEEDYFLLVDQSFAEIKDWNSPGYGPTKQKVIAFYEALRDFSEEKGASLLVKLHPYSYSSDFFEGVEGVRFIKETDLVPLLFKAKAVFGFFSSLMLPAVYYKPCILFRMFDESDFINRVEELGLANVVEYEKFDSSDLKFPDSKPQQGLAKFEAEYLHKADGKNTSRLAELLNS